MGESRGGCPRRNVDRLARPACLASRTRTRPRPARSGPDRAARPTFLVIALDFCRLSAIFPCARQGLALQHSFHPFCRLRRLELADPWSQLDPCAAIGGLCPVSCWPSHRAAGPQPFARLRSCMGGCRICVRTPMPGRLPCERAAYPPAEAKAASWYASVT